MVPPHMLRRIDRAFDRISNLGKSNDVRSKAISSTTSQVPGGFSVDEEPAAGGFIIEDAPGGFILDDPPGGFLPDKPNTDYGKHAQYLPLSLVPTALQQLNLPPDDPEILDVFRNAASGWGGDANAAGAEQVVSRDDWRSVCAVLLVHDDADVDVHGASERTSAADADVDGMSRDDDDKSDDVWTEDADGSSADEYMAVDASSDAADNASDDDYAPEPRAGPSRTSKARRRGRSALPSFTSDDDDDDGAPRALTPQEKADCLTAFGLFLPGVPETEVSAQKLMIKDIARVAQVLKEKLTAEDIIEMLDAFSTSKDKTVTLGDFEQMMIATKMV